MSEEIKEDKTVGSRYKILSGDCLTMLKTLKEGFRFIGIERETEYIKIAEARIAYQMKEVV